MEERDEDICENKGVAPERVVTARKRTRTIFQFEELKRVATSLNLSSPTRHVRSDPTKEIALHSRKNADATMRFLILDLANWVMAKSKRLSKQRYKVFGYAATFLFHDYGYKAVCSISNLDRL